MNTREWSLPLPWQFPTPVCQNTFLVDINHINAYGVVGMWLDRTEWDITRFSDWVKNLRPRSDFELAAEDQKLAKFFKNPNFGHLDEPATLLDCNGLIMAWHLPDIFQVFQVVSTIRVPITNLGEALFWYFSRMSMLAPRASDPSWINSCNGSIPLSGATATLLLP